MWLSLLISILATIHSYSYEDIILERTTFVVPYWAPSERSRGSIGCTCGPNASLHMEHEEKYFFFIETLNIFI